MRFGGHETFFLRPGWTTKGLMLLEGVPDLAWNSDQASDAMGVGRNMSKSIGWWLGRTGLAHRPVRGAGPALTALGRSVLEFDPHLTRTATLWIIHLHLVLHGEDDVFSWFFCQHRDRRFTRGAIEGALRAHLEQAGDAAPAPKTLQRDLAVLLQSYARAIPSPVVDPEDNLDCPLRRLGLLVHRQEIDAFERRDTATVLPPEAIASAICSLKAGAGVEFVGVAMDEAGIMRTLGRVFGRDANGMAELVRGAADALERDLFEIRHLAGQREVRVRNLTPDIWLMRHVRRTAPQPSTAAEETCLP